MQPEKINFNLNSDDSILVAVSAGPDSMALLGILIEKQKEIGFDLAVGHVNHGLREESQEEEEFLKDFCETNNIPIYIKHIREEEYTGQLTEQKAREIRYGFLFSVMKEHGIKKLYTAHHQGDQAETVLLNLIRGTGIKGFRGIKEKQEVNNIEIIRPLLGLNKVDLLNYNFNHGIDYRIDKTNSENEFARNRIRNKIIPEIQKINDKALNNISRSTELIGGAEHFIDNLIDHYSEIWLKRDPLGIIIPSRLFLKTEAFLFDYHLDFLDKESQEYLLQEIIRQAALKLDSITDLTKKHISLTIDFFRENGSGHIELPNDLLAANMSGTFRLFKRGNIPKPFDRYLLKDFRKKILYFPENRKKLEIRKAKRQTNKKKYEDRIVLPPEIFNKDLEIRSRNSGDEVYLSGMSGKKKLNRFMIDRKIPQVLRDSLPFLACGDTVIWIPGYYLHREYSKGKFKNGYEFIISDM